MLLVCYQRALDKNPASQLFVLAKSRSSSSLNAFDRTAGNHKIIVNRPLKSITEEQLN